MIINESLIDLNVNLKTKEEVVRYLTGLAIKEGRVDNEDNYVQAVMNREKEYSTGMGFGIAIPHGKSAAVKEPFLCFGKVDSVEWNSLDGNPVNLVFMIGVPEAAGSEHLKILAKISRKLMKQDFRDDLNNIKTSAELMEFLLKSELGI